MTDSSDIKVIDDFIPMDLHDEIQEMLSRPMWAYGWQSNAAHDRFCFWHAHFAGGNGKSRKSCINELADNRNAAPIFKLWQHLSKSVLIGHEPLRAYANAHTYGVEGYAHKDSTDEENYFTCILYAHPVWRVNWAGELLFFDENSDDIMQAVYPRPGRLLLFPGAITHRAQGPSRECPELRISLVFKTQLVRQNGSGD